MLGELQKRKITKMFSLYDTDQNGYLEKSDFDRIVGRIAELYKLAPASAEYKNMVAKYDSSWNQLRGLADQNRDKRITLEEFLSAHDKLLGNKIFFPLIIRGLTESVIKLMDRDQDGKLNRAEVLVNLQAYGLDDATAQAAFGKLDRNGDGVLTKTEVLKNVEEFYYSNDPDAVGNWLIGPY